MLAHCLTMQSIGAVFLGDLVSTAPTRQVQLRIAK